MGELAKKVLLKSTVGNVTVFILLVVRWAIMPSYIIYACKVIIQEKLTIMIKEKWHLLYPTNTSVIFETIKILI